MKKKKINYHRDLEAIGRGNVRCKACGEDGDFFSMHQATCSAKYKPCSSCGGQDDSNDCTGWCKSKSAWT